MIPQALGNKSVMKHSFARVPTVDIPRSTFKRSHGYKTSFNSGYLVPILVDEILPGDTFKVNLSSVARLATPTVPIMDNLNMDFFFFFVPNRLLWTNWQKFMGEQDDPGDSTDFTPPVITCPSGGWTEDSLEDYFGLPIGEDNADVISFWHRGYNLIYNQWFRDQNLQDSLVVDTDDGPDDSADYALVRRCKRHDYFTSCLPWPQKGTAVDLPLGTQAPLVGSAQVYGDSSTSMIMAYGNQTTITANKLYADSIAAETDAHVNFGGSVSNKYELNIADSGDTNVTADLTTSGCYADLSSATAATINSLREAFQLQRMMEKDARGGTRYIELLQSHFGVTSPDARLQRPEYLGGGSTSIQISPIPQTSEAGTTPQGTLAAIGYHQQSHVGFTKSFVEHGILMCLANVRADLTYQKGLHRMWTREDREDFYFPSLAHLGEQAVLNKEIYFDNAAADDEAFGYQERWAEYRYKPSQITAQLRSDATNSLDVWHLSQDFASLPTLGDTFIQENPPVDRIIATTNEDEFIFDGYFDMTVTRCMPMYSVPGYIDHF